MEQKTEEEKLKIIIQKELSKGKKLCESLVKRNPTFFLKQQKKELLYCGVLIEELQKFLKEFPKNKYDWMLQEKTAIPMLIARIKAHGENYKLHEVYLNNDAKAIIHFRCCLEDFIFIFDTCFYIFKENTNERNILVKEIKTLKDTFNDYIRLRQEESSAFLKTPKFIEQTNSVEECLATEKEIQEWNSVEQPYD